jgi:hypothetical protein
MRLTAMSARLACAALLAAGVAACGGGLSDAAYNYCVNEAGPAELDAAAQALNIAPDPDHSFQGNPNRDDPAFQRVCEYAWNARGRNVNPPAGQQPAQEGSPTAPLDPQRSPDAPSAAPVAPASPASS